MPTYSNNAWEGRRASLNAQQKVSDSVSQMNMANAKDKKEEFKKLVYGLATGNLMNRKNTQAELDSGNQLGSFTGDNKEEWGASVGTHHIFFNPAVKPNEPTPTQYVQPDPPKAPPMPEMPLPKPEYQFNDKLQGDNNLNMVRPIETKLNLDFNDFTNFDLGKADASNYNDWFNSLDGEGKKRVDKVFGGLTNPQAIEALGQLQFGTGTDATRMSPESIDYYTKAWNEVDAQGNKGAMRQWAESQGLSNLDDKTMQYMLGKRRYDVVKQRIVEGAKARGIELPPELLKEYSIKDHKLGSKKDNRSERYSRVQSVNGKEVTVKGQVPDTVVNPNAKPNPGRMPWQASGFGGQQPTPSVQAPNNDSDYSEEARVRGLRERENEVEQRQLQNMSEKEGYPPEKTDPLWWKMYSENESRIKPYNKKLEQYKKSKFPDYYE